MKIIIAGAYAIGTYLAQLLSRNRYDITLIDDNEENLEKLGRDYDLLTMTASPTSIRAMREAGVDHADLFIAVTLDENKNILACTLARQLGAKRTVAKVDTYEHVSEDSTELFKQLGISSLI